MALRSTATMLQLEPVCSAENVFEGGHSKTSEFAPKLQTAAGSDVRLCIDLNDRSVWLFWVKKYRFGKKNRRYNPLSKQQSAPDAL